MLLFVVLKTLRMTVVILFYCYFQFVQGFKKDSKVFILFIQHEEGQATECLRFDSKDFNLVLFLYKLGQRQL